MGLSRAGSRWEGGDGGGVVWRLRTQPLVLEPTEQELYTEVDSRFILHGEFAKSNVTQSRAVHHPKNDPPALLEKPQRGEVTKPTGQWSLTLWRAHARRQPDHGPRVGGEVPFGARGHVESSRHVRPPGHPANRTPPVSAISCCAQVCDFRGFVRRPVWKSPTPLMMTGSVGSHESNQEGGRADVTVRLKLFPVFLAHSCCCTVTDR